MEHDIGTAATSQDRPPRVKSQDDSDKTDPLSERDRTSENNFRLFEDGDIPRSERYDELDVSKLHELGDSYEDRYQRLNKLGDLDDLIRCLSRALALSPGNGPQLPHSLNRLGVSHQSRFRRLREQGDFEKSIEYISRAIALAPDAPNLAVWLTNLGESHGFRNQYLGELDDLEKTIDYTSRALALTIYGDPELRYRLLLLGISHDNRYGRLGDPVDVDKSIEYFTCALVLIPDGDPKLAYWLSRLGMSHSFRFYSLSKPDDLEKCIEFLSRAVALVHDDDPNLPGWLEYLGVFHDERFRRLGELTDVERAIEYRSRGVALTPEGDSNLPNRLHNLVESHYSRFDHLGELDDIEKTIEYLTRAVTLTLNGDPNLIHQLQSLGISHQHRFKCLDNLDDMEKSIKYQSQALSLAPEDYPGLVSLVTNLGGSHLLRFRRLGELKDIEKAAEYANRAIALTPQGDPSLPQWLECLGICHDERFKRLGELEDVEKAVECNSRALALTPSGDPALPKRLHSLAVSHGHRFRCLAELTDNEKSIEYASHALSLTPDSDSKLPHWLDSLGICYIDRFKYLGELDDVEKSIEYITRALTLAPEGHPDLARILNRLGTCLGDRFQRLGKLDDLEKSIGYISRALALTPDGHPDMANWLTGLGICYEDRFKHLNDLDDLEKAIEYTSGALAATPRNHPDWARHLTRLAECYEHRFIHLDQQVDLKTALKYTYKALDIIYESHPDFSRMYELSARLSLHQFRLTGSHEIELLQNALDCFRKASKSPIEPPGSRFRIALRWAKRASVIDLLDRIEAYQTAMDLLPEFIWLGATTNQRYKDLGSASNLAIAAASAAIVSSNHSLALEWLEHARCVVWNQSAMLRSPLDQLNSLHPALAERLQQVANQLYIASLEPGDSHFPEQAGQKRRSLAREYNDLLSQTRSLPEFNDFLRPMKASSLTRAARIGPIVVVNCHKAYCDALLIMPGQDDIGHVSLPDFTEEKALQAYSEMEGSLRQKGLRERGFRIREEPEQKGMIKRVLATLWTDIVKPILDALGYTSDNSSDGLPHITWCPTGTLSFLPFHAAGDYNQPQSRVFDYAVSSYTPTLSALLSTFPSSLGPGSRALAIGQEYTPGHTPLPGTIKELAHVKGHIQHVAEYTQIINDQATTAVVLDAMEQHDWVHLACHAHQNVENATKSGFSLHDGTLDLASINRRSFKGKGLAFLSACQTAKGDEHLPDEAVHLASGMLMAGYTSVIATMWSVHDEDAPLVADSVYAQLMKHGKLGNGEAGKALHNAVAELRESVGVEKFERWVPYIHIGS